MNKETIEEVARMFNIINGFNPESKMGEMHFKRYPEDIPETIKSYEEFTRHINNK